MDNFKPLDLFGETTSEVLKNEVVSELNQEESPLPKVLSEKMDVKEENESDLEIINNKKDIEQENINEMFLKRVEVMYEQFSKQLLNMQTLFDKRIMYTDYEDRIISQMHEELQKYKQDLYAQLIRPILLDIIEIRDSIIRISKAYLDKPESEQAIPNKMFLEYACELQDILEKNDVEIYHGNIGDPFVAIRQQIVKKEITNDKTLHGKIANCLSCGYSYAGKVISAEKVSVYFYEKLKEGEGNLNG